MPVTIPVLPIAAMVGALLLHVPPLIVSLKVAVASWQIYVLPVIIPGRATDFTVSIAEAATVPQLLATL